MNYVTVEHYQDIKHCKSIGIIHVLLQQLERRMVFWYI